jgi:hypothetical protein
MPQRKLEAAIRALIHDDVAPSRMKEPRLPAAEAQITQRIEESAYKLVAKQQP